MRLPLTPQDLGLPEKFREWRGCQELAIGRALQPGRRFQDHAMPTGSGKSLAYVAAALISGERTLILTSTKGLQDQIMRDFGACGVVDLRGQQNYACRMGPGVNCEHGKLAGCQDAKTTACPHRRAIEVAKRSQVVVTNYACWIANLIAGENLGRWDAIVMDEAHSAPDEVCGMMSVEVTSAEVLGMLGADFPETEEPEDWRAWASMLVPQATVKRDTLAQLVSADPSPSLSLVAELRRWTSLVRKLSRLSDARGPWVVEATRSGYRADPLWPSQYAEQVVFNGAPKVYAYSATVTPKTLHIMGAAPDEVEYFEYPSVFPASRSPVYRIPTCRVDRHMDASSRALWISRIDQIVGQRLDRKGIIHCVSYERRKEIMESSAYGRYMVGHTREDTAETIRWFRDARPPLVLVSPSVTTGYDFPLEDCEFQIVAKLPFPDSRSKVMRARANSDPLYIPYLTIQTLIQETGRGMRSTEDQCENFILDDHIARMLAAHRDQFLGWWLKLYQRRNLIPDPPPPLGVSGQPLTTYQGG
jgi:Rad3-related DNA helicase